MKIFGFNISITKVNKPGLEVENELDMITYHCNNQIRGILNKKAIENNYETIEYYIRLAYDLGVKKTDEAWYEYRTLKLKTPEDAEN